ncbi:hypothetical protein CHARACLAT_009931 [Characodon lateralis]|uniref:Uncharacterized protein n=1 Tax=Characodon lateralis TaxID=208331 RepID=A0ABU7EBI3_9TELE|nr:hypothetical protein [Characodon lateralis]
MRVLGLFRLRRILRLLGLLRLRRTLRLLGLMRILGLLRMGWLPEVPGVAEASEDTEGTGVAEDAEVSKAKDMKAVVASQEGSQVSLFEQQPGSHGWRRPRDRSKSDSLEWTVLWKL